MGINGEPVSLAAGEGLAAAFSLVSEREAAPSVERATAFARVVDAFHNAGTVLPLRYGCLLDTPGQVAQLLQDRRAEFLAALSRLDGCLEMGIRVLLPEADARGKGDGSLSPERPASCFAEKTPVPFSSGRGYLALRGAYYAAREGADRQAADVAASARAALDGLYRETRLEPPTASRMRVLSLCFLVRREHLAAFRAAFAQFEAQCRQRVMLTGPWPPYSFAGPDDARGHGDNPADAGPRRACGMASIGAAQEKAAPQAAGWDGLAPQVHAPQRATENAGCPRPLARPLL